MSSTLSEIFMAIIMLAVSIVLVVWFLKYLATRSERRMVRMLMRAGLDPEILNHGDHEEIINDIRRRCHKCQTESVCEKWLDGEETGDNDFCPNAQVFSSLNKAA